MNTAWWRKWHRWIGFPAAAFLLFASITGMLVAFSEFFGEAEALREATRDLVSPVSTSSAPEAWTEPLARAMAIARDRAAGAPTWLSAPPAGRRRRSRPAPARLRPRHGLRAAG
ncbi:MAG: PepSY domain-containing protein [Vicinamibacterales bacterium]